MSVAMFFGVLVLAWAAALFIFRAVPALQAPFRYRGKQLVTCPKTHKPEAVDGNRGEAALGAFLSEPTLRLKECSRWPERQNCGQDCLQQIEADPENCLLWNIVSQWCEGKTCMLCHKPFPKLHRLDHAPALFAPDHKTLEWKEFLPSSFPKSLSPTNRSAGIAT
jgi:hypothetical protein